MLDRDTIEQQQALLIENRRRLAVLLQQQARLGDYAPPHIRLEIEDTQAAIRNLKETLRAAGGAVEDEPNDDARAAAGAILSRLSPQEQRNRSRMLDKVEAFWIKGVLEQSLYQIARLELGFEHTPAQVSHPWETVIHQANQPNQSIPAGKPIVAVFDDLLGELLILGAPGAGKTTTLLELTRDLLARARQNEQHPIPVVFNLSTWATKRRPLKDWLADELNQRYDVPKKLAQEFVNNNVVLPLLDGLDEVAAEHRDACVEAINAFHTGYSFVPLAVCSRTADYEALTTKLRLQGAIIIQPLTKPQVDDYLKGAGRPLATVRAALRDEPALWELMDTPLMLSIVALAYKDTSAAKLRASGTPVERRRQLFDDYITAMFARLGRSTRASYTQDETIDALAWLANKMVEQQQMILFIERMQPSWLDRVGRLGFALRVGLFTALVFGLLAGLGFGLGGGLLVGLSVELRPKFSGAPLSLPLSLPLSGLRGALLGALGGGLLAGLVGGARSYLAEIRPVEILRWSWAAAGGGWRSSLAGALVVGLVAAVVGLVAAAFSELAIVVNTGPPAGLVEVLIGLLYNVLVVGVSSGPAGWILGWLVGEVANGQPIRRALVENPQFRRLVWQMAAFGLLCGLSFGLLVGWRYNGLATVASVAPIGLRAGLLGALAGGLATNDLTTHTVDRHSFRRAAWFALASGLAGGVIYGLLSHRPSAVLSGGLGGTILGWFGSWLGGQERMQRTSLPTPVLHRFARNALGLGLVYGLVSGLISGLMISSAGMGGGLVYGVTSGWSFGLLGVLFGGILTGLTEGDIAIRTVTNEGIRRSLRSAAVSGVCGGLVVGAVSGLNVGMESSALFTQGWLIIGLIYGLLAGLVVGLVVGLLHGGATVLQHYTLRYLLWRSGDLPLRLAPLLDYCAERIFLRKVGGGYIFIHRLLMEHFASLNTEQPTREPIEALAGYDQAIILNPQDATVYNNRGLARYDLGDLKGAIEDYDQAIILNPQDATVYNNRGLARYDQGDLKGAIEDYDQAIILNPQDAAAYTNRGAARYDQGDLKGAIGDYKQFVHRLLMEYFPSLKREPVEALADYDQAIALNPENTAAYYNRANTRADQGDLQGALADYDQAIALNPQDAGYYNNRGRARHKQGDLQGAIEDSNQAIALNPKNAGYYNNRGVARYDQGDLKGALADYDQAIALDSKDARAYYNRGIVRHTQGDLKGALADYDQAIVLDPKDARAYNNRGTARADQGDLKGALANYDQAIALDPKNVAAYYNRASTRADQGDLQGASADYDQAIALDPKSASTYCGRGVVYQQLGDCTHAIADFEQVLHLTDDVELRREAEKNLRELQK